MIDQAQMALGHLDAGDVQGHRQTAFIIRVGACAGRRQRLFGVIGPVFEAFEQRLPIAGAITVALEIQRQPIQGQAIDGDFAAQQRCERQADRGLGEGSKGLGVIRLIRQARFGLGHADTNARIEGPLQWAFQRQFEPGVLLHHGHQPRLHVLGVEEGGDVDHRAHRDQGEDADDRQQGSYESFHLPLSPVGRSSWKSSPLRVS